MGGPQYDVIKVKKKEECKGESELKHLKLFPNAGNFPHYLHLDGSDLKNYA